MKGILFKPGILLAKLKVLGEYGEAQTRRLHGLKEINAMGDWKFKYVDGSWYASEKHGYQCAVKPRYQAGEFVYIQEAYSHYADNLNCGIWTAQVKYKLDEVIRYIPFAHTIPPREKWWGTSKYQSPLFMPEWAARYFILITDVWVERLQKITTEDCLAEGVDLSVIEGLRSDYSIKKAFQGLWNSINKPPYDWDSNPWCFVYTFKSS